MPIIRLEEGDISAADVDAVVNAANTRLVLGSGVAGALRRRGGPEIQRECDTLAPIALGDAILTGAGDLPARHVIHAATMEPGGSSSEASVRSATRRALEIARERGLESLALPALGAGVGGLTLAESARVMLEELRSHLAQGSSLRDIRLVLYGEPAYRIFEEVHDSERIRAQLATLAKRTP